MVWCGLYAAGIIGIGLYIFIIEADLNVIVKNAHYRSIIKDYLLLEIEARGLDNIWF